jgi:hypothetical protein
MQGFRPRDRQAIPGPHRPKNLWGSGPYYPSHKMHTMDLLLSIMWSCCLPGSIFFDLIIFLTIFFNFSFRRLGPLPQNGF